MTSTNKLRSLNRQKTGFTSIEAGEKRSDVLGLVEEGDDDLGAPTQIPESIKPYIEQNFQDQEVAVLVSDMSGFTKLTRKHGIIHFASIIARTRQLCLPILHRFGAIHISTEADNFIVVMSSAAGAVLAAREMQGVAAAYNKALPPERIHFAMTLDGIGIDFGSGPLVDISGKLHGTTFTNAYVLGEEMCEKGSVSFSSRVKNEIEKLPEFSTAQFSQRTFGEEDPVGVETAAKMGGIFELTMEEGEPVNLLDTEDATSLDARLMPLARRHSSTISQADLEALDRDITKSSMQRKTVLMLEFAFEGTDDSYIQLGLKFDCISRINMLLEKHKGVAVEDVMYVFDEPTAALLMAVDLRRELRKPIVSGASGQDKPSVSVKGYGVHTGNLLFILGTDIHWGDPVNTASKLGQDIACGGEIIISTEVREAVKGAACAQLRFMPSTFVKSGVTFDCYKVDDERSDADKAVIRQVFQSVVGGQTDLTLSVFKEVLQEIIPAHAKESVDVLLTCSPALVHGHVNIDAFLDWLFVNSAS